MKRNGQALVNCQEPSLKSASEKHEQNLTDRAGHGGLTTHTKGRRKALCNEGITAMLERGKEGAGAEPPWDFKIKREKSRREH